MSLFLFIYGLLAVCLCSVSCICVQLLFFSVGHFVFVVITLDSGKPGNATEFDLSTLWKEKSSELTKSQGIVQKITCRGKRLLLTSYLEQH